MWTLEGSKEQHERGVSSAAGCEDTRKNAAQWNLTLMTTDDHVSIVHRALDGSLVAFQTCGLTFRCTLGKMVQYFADTLLLTDGTSFLR